MIPQPATACAMIPPIMEAAMVYGIAQIPLKAAVKQTCLQAMSIVVLVLLLVTQVSNARTGHVYKQILVQVNLI